jgi:DNA-binding NarL/FixJ family response regulator
MAFTGDLEYLHIVDIIQLVNTTRKSGAFAVQGEKGESRIIFSNGYIVAASHLNGKVRIGTVLVKMKAISVEDLRQAIEAQQKAGKDRKPLIATLIEQGKAALDDATRALRKLVEITIVELIGWKKGTFTFDPDIVYVTPECAYPVSKMEQEIALDAQMVLMDALRIFDEQQRDREAGRPFQADEDLFADVIPDASSVSVAEKTTITADDLGLGDLDRLERKMPQYLPPDEVFDPQEIHRQKIREILAGFPDEEQEAFVEFLEKSTAGRDNHEAPAQKRQAKALILLSDDELIKHSVMTICKAGDVLVFSAEGEEELDRIMEQCLRIKVLPVMVFDDPGEEHRLLSRETVISLRKGLKDRYPEVPVLQLAPASDYFFTLESFRDGAIAVFPKPSRQQHETFISDTISLLGTIKTYIRGMLGGQDTQVSAQGRLSVLRDRIIALRNLTEAPAVSLALLQFVSESCERAITFIVRPEELEGEKSIGVFADKSDGPTSVSRLKVPLPKNSALRGMIDSGWAFCGKIDDEALSKHLYEAIGEPLSPEIIFLPVKGRGETMTLVYGDFGGKEGSAVQCDALEILAGEAGLVLENLVQGRRIDTASQG